MVDIWSAINGIREIKPMMAKIFRFVESQEQIATLSLVNDVYEQGVLEDLLESSKNPLPEKAEALHYLLKTPFRYPPLKYGSRFGSPFEPGLFYGSLNLATALAETAYYRFVYMLGPEISFPSSISSEYSSFAVHVNSKSAVFLDEPPFKDHESILTSPVSYAETQFLGTNMRRDAIDIFRYTSARDKNKGRNVALFNCNAFHNNKPLELTTWLCQTSVEEVGFFSRENNRRMMFTQQDFCINGCFPAPAV